MRTNQCSQKIENGKQELWTSTFEDRCVSWFLLCELSRPRNNLSPFLSVMFSTSNNFGTLWKYSSQWENLFFYLLAMLKKTGPV